MKRFILFILCLALASLACLQTTEPFVTYPAPSAPTPIAESTIVPAAAAVVVEPTSANAKQLCALVIADESLHLRAKASEKSQVLDYLMNGQQVIVVELSVPPAAGSTSRWWKIQTPSGKIGYANAKYLQEEKCK
jgi:uncharacterized protein YgiM (DUF1202 family)